MRNSLSAVEKESMHQLDNLIATIERLIASAGLEAPRIRADLESLESLRIEALRREV